ncbi:hypothetical protein NLJ89_g4888 [Agrocybe chaxingu]|uniref:G-patch domain-containing protein n=1 Tax=Agrocybe chaxingu TaxID=84603 RepID=A0A9W8MVI7_9AGAR|nr:hypothetical protein NLJ89_g4888 [Agrocybe chaxingu]
MARRKRVLDDGDDSDSSAVSDPDFDFGNDPDAREERALFENPYRKRRRTNGKEDALYGVFAENSDDEKTGRRGMGSKSKRSDWTKAPAFVAGDKPVNLDDAMDVDLDETEGNQNVNADNSEDDEKDDSEDDGSEGEDETRDDAEYSNESEPSRVPSPRVRIDEEEEEEEASSRPRMGGLGFSNSASSQLPSFSKGGIGSSRSEQSPFAAPSRGGIGSKPSASPAPEDNGTSSRPSPAADSVPSAFVNRTQSFNRPANPSPKPVALPASERAHFSKIQNTFGARMLAKMGWQAGSGLGAEGEGIVTPIESKLRPQKMGIAFKGFKEKTEQSKLEAKRRGEVVSDDEDAKTKKMRKKVKEQEQKRSDAWKRPKKVKTKVEHKTYEQILAETGEEVVALGIGQIIDATGAVPREVSSLADISLNTWSPSNDPTRIPEVRHNIRLIADACKADLDGLAREAKALQERRKFVTTEDARLRKRVEDEAELIARLQQVQLVANDISTTARDLSSVYEVSLEPFSPLFQKLINEYSPEYDRYRLDEIVVAAIAPVVRRMAANWSPLEDPIFVLPTFKSWKAALKVTEKGVQPDTQVDVYGSKTVSINFVDIEKPMTPFDSLLWNIWLPKVRTSINNDWSPDKPQQAVRLYEAWSSFLPPFIRDNLLDQLILPKVHKAVAEWNPRQAKVSLQAIVFPWLPHVGLRLEDVVGDARRKIKSLLRSWVIDEPIPADLLAWKDVFDADDWDAMILKHVVPKLGATLRTDFRVNPRDQKMEPLNHVLAWEKFIRPSIFSQILETGFFPKWLDVLHFWLIQPHVSFEEVADWYYKFWKKAFSEDVRALSGVERGFTRGLQLMNKAIDLGPDAPTKLAKPDFLAEIAAANSPRPVKDGTKTSRPSARTHEITFRSIVEEYAASHDLLFIPTGKAHERSRMPIFRVIGDAPNIEREEFKAISLEDMVLRSILDHAFYIVSNSGIHSLVMSTKKSSKLDLLVRVRYSNPLPPPPCPPKLLNIPTNPMRYVRPEFLNALASETQLPMIVDAECGMPLDLGKYECLWEEDADDSFLNPDPRNLPKLDPKDAFLLADPSSSTGAYPVNGGSHPSSTSVHTTPRANANVSWLRKTEYISRDSTQRNGIQEPKHVVSAPIDVSRNAQLRDIEASFVASNENFSLESLRHPNKPNVTAVESYPILPDADIWANQYDLFRFSERPGERPVDAEDPRLDCAILRPMKTEHDSFLAFYLTQDDESAVRFKKTRFAVPPYEVPENQEETLFHFVRDYETVKVEQEVPNEFLLVLYDGDPPEGGDAFLDGSKKLRETGAYYKTIERKMHLKKKRANAYDQYEDKWEIIRVQHAPMSKEEEEEREEALAEVADPMFLLMRADADADGEIDETATFPMNGLVDVVSGV